MARAAALSFALGGALTACGGTLLSTFYTFNASMGVVFTMKALIIVIMGGVGDVRGAVIAALILGIAETAVARLIDPGLTLGCDLRVVHASCCCSGRRAFSAGSRHDAAVRR